MPPLALLLFMIMIELLRNEFQREHVVFVCLVVVFLLFGEHDYEDLPRMLETSTKVEVSRVLPSALHTHFNSIELNNEAVYRTIIKNKQYTEALNKCCTQPCTNEVLELKGVKAVSDGLFKHKTAGKYLLLNIKTKEAPSEDELIKAQQMKATIQQGLWYQKKIHALSVMYMIYQVCRENNFKYSLADDVIMYLMCNCWKIPDANLCSFDAMHMTLLRAHCVCNAVRPGISYGIFGKWMFSPLMFMAIDAFIRRRPKILQYEQDFLEKNNLMFCFGVALLLFYPSQYVVPEEYAIVQTVLNALAQVPLPIKPAKLLSYLMIFNLIFGWECLCDIIKFGVFVIETMQKMPGYQDVLKNLLHAISASSWVAWALSFAFQMATAFIQPPK